MAFTDLRDFLARLEKDGRLRRVTAPVSRDLEITEIVDRVSKTPGEGNVALLFEHVDGFDMPVLVNAFGSEARMAAALEVEPAGRARRARGQAARRAAARNVRRAPAQARHADGRRARRAPHGRSGALPGDRRDGVALAGRPADLAVLARRRRPLHHAARRVHARSRHRRAQRRHVSPASLRRSHARHALADPQGRRRARAPRDRTDAGGDRARRRSGDDLRRLGAPAARPRRSRLRRLAARPRRRDGALAARWISRCRPAPRSCWRAGSIRASASWKGRSAITPATTRWPATIRSFTSRRSPGAPGRSIPTTIVGRPPQEDYWLGKATERIFLPIMRLMLPEIVDVNMPAEGVFHNLVIVSIRKRYPGQARKVMQALWGMGLMMLAKTIVVVSEHVNVHDLSEVAWRATGNIDPRRDLVDHRGPDGRSRPRRAPPSLRRQARRGRDGEGSARRRHAGLARGDP